jgi:Fur family iron response transcriptional regulator
LRPTKQRVQICEVLFNTEKTFHFTINELEQKIKDKIDNQISLATIYNTVRAFEKKGYLKQIPINSNQTYFDTNVNDHHHFYDLKDGKLIDLENSDVGPINIKRKIDGKKIKSIEVLVKLED